MEERFALFVMRLFDQWTLVREGARIAGRQVTRVARSAKPQRFAGSPAEICKQVVAACWNGTYFRAGIDHLDQFWIRDFAISLEGLIDLGYADQCRQNLEWALERYAAAGRVTTTIFLDKEPVDIFTYSSDSLPFLLYSLERLGLTGLRKRYRDLLTRETSLYYVKIFDSTAGHARANEMFSATKDTMNFTGTCYTNTMVAWLSKLLSRCEELPNPFRKFDLDKVVNQQFWNGEFFRNDLHTKPDLCSGDANFWPYWCGVVENSGEKFPRSVAAVSEAGLDDPFPLKYHPERMPDHELTLQRWFIPNYQGDSIWTFFTPQWIELVGTIDEEKAHAYTRSYCKWLDEYGTWVEVFAPGGEHPLRGRLSYGSDWGMLWAANFPRVIEKFGGADRDAEA